MALLLIRRMAREEDYNKTLAAERSASRSLRTTFYSRSFMEFYTAKLTVPPYERRGAYIKGSAALESSPRTP